MAEDGLDETTFNDIIDGFFDDNDLGLSKGERQQEIKTLQAIYADNVVKEQDKEQVSEQPKASKIIVPGDDAQKAQKSSSSVMDWIKGIIVDDLGFGFGWAAFYFTLFTAWWGGQTPGKRIMGIRVIQLDGTRLGLWDSFGRYGGYGAGFATGLLGFFQIYWDPNRQAIQDKISATVVIKGDIPEDRQPETTPQLGDKPDADFK
jgi:hypothetical protein